MKVPNYKRRLLILLKLLIKYSDSDHYINSKDLIDKISKEINEDIERKAIITDIQALKDSGYHINSIQGRNAGYSIEETPFTLSEIKILIDLLNSFKNISDKDKDRIINKLYSFISIYNKKLLDDINISINQNKNQSLYLIEAILEAIKNKESLILKIRNKESEVMPHLLHLNNDYYYLYYSYLNNERIYHVRLDNIKKLSYTSNKHNSANRYEDCLKLISESVNSFSSDKLKEVKLELLDDTSFVVDDILDSFDTAIRNKNIISIKVRISDIFFSKIASYSDHLKIIAPIDVVNDYKTFLIKILDKYPDIQ